MKIFRSKKSNKILAFFATNFDYHEPYQILIDATFCQAALQNKVIIEQQLKNYFQTQVKLLTTQCIILEAESLGAPLTGATMIVKQFYVHKCGHEGKPVSAAECMMAMAKNSRYIVASQDRALQERLRKVPGRCLLYLHKATPVLEAPSKASKKYVLRKSKNTLSSEVEGRIQHMKTTSGLPATSVVIDTAQKKPKTPKNPNPLSCKKSKKQKAPQTQTKQATIGLNNHSKVFMKPKRKRIRIPAHVKDVIQAKIE